MTHLVCFVLSSTLQNVTWYTMLPMSRLLPLSVMVNREDGFAWHDTVYTGNLRSIWKVSLCLKDVNMLLLFFFSLLYTCTCLHSKSGIVFQNCTLYVNRTSSDEFLPSTVTTTCPLISLLPLAPVLHVILYNNWNEVIKVRITTSGR